MHRADRLSDREVVPILLPEFREQIKERRDGHLGLVRLSVAEELELNLILLLRQPKQKKINKKIKPRFWVLTPGMSSRR